MSAANSPSVTMPPTDNIPDGCRMGRRGALPQIYDPAEGVSLQLGKLSCTASSPGASSSKPTTPPTSPSEKPSSKDDNKS